MTSNTIAFFGATGGCANSALALSLKAGYKCSVLVRRPERLTEMLKEAGVSEEAISKQLHVVEGNVREVKDVKATLQPAEGTLCYTIISGIGFKPGHSGTSLETKLCADAANIIIEAVSELNYDQKPVVSAVSSTGVSKTGKRDVPLLLYPVYKIVLKVYHDDKYNMEQNLFKGFKDGKLGGAVTVRASLLTDGKELGSAKIRTGDESNPAVGYSISRKDVGRWIFENSIVKGAGKGEEKKVNITY